MTVTMFWNHVTLDWQSRIGFKMYERPGDPIPLKQPKSHVQQGRTTVLMIGKASQRVDKHILHLG